MIELCVEELSDVYRKLIEASLKASESAYAVYSKFNVGAALLDKMGNVFVGCNVENASSGATICAERAAVCNAILHGSREYVAIAIATASSGAIIPCGICRQTLCEFSKNMDIICTNGLGKVRIYDLEELLPEPFDLNGRNV